MNSFTARALSKLPRMDTEEISRFIMMLDAQNEMLSNILDSLSDGILLLDHLRTVLYVNPAVSVLVPVFRKRNWYGLTLTELINDEDVVQFLQSSLDTVKTVTQESAEFHYQRGGEIKSIIVTVSALSSEMGETIEPGGTFALVHITDITERRKSETRLRRSESLASMTTVAAGVAHEIKNPLASISIHLQLLRKAFERKEQLSKEDADRYISVIDEEINRLNAIVVDFLFAVRPMDVHPELTDLGAVLEELCDFITPETEEMDISLQREIAPFLPKVELDANLFKAALLNIIKNAMAAMPLGGLLSVTAKQEGDVVEIRIGDTGTGMSAETVGKIFEPYFTTKATGTGLGLTVVYKIIREHQGDISVHSVEGEGTVFTLSLPVPASERKVLPSESCIKGVAEEAGNEANHTSRR